LKRTHIVAIGAAVQDVFLEGKIFKPQKEHGELVNEFELGTKNEIDRVTISTGGGATNASVTFAKLGLNSWFMGRIGEDVAGRVVLESLADEKVNTSLVWASKELGTGYSTLLLAPSGERTILTYRGASSAFQLQTTRFKSVKPDWFYISSLSGDIESLETIVAYAKKRKIKIAVNPGKGELKERVRFKKLLDDFSILSINKEEMEELFGTADLFTLLKKANEHVGIVVVTDGPRGSYVIDGSKIYKAGMYKNVKVVDRAGAGDAFCSGFVAMIANGKTVEEAITYGSANSTSVVSKIGAKAGILRTNRGLDTMKIQTTNL
jgi:ribokinase